VDLGTVTAVDLIRNFSGDHPGYHHCCVDCGVLMIKNPYTARPTEVGPGDVFVRQITVHIGWDGEPMMYLCPSDHDGCEYADSVPQGNRIYLPLRQISNLFPVLYHYLHEQFGDIDKEDEEEE
jgi:hypothetical protein